jgi:RNA polymerase sigma-70 factor (ECF subfamily)
MTGAALKKLEQLYCENRELMLYVANQIFHDPYLAEDAVQQAFQRIILYGPEKVNVNRARNLLVTIVRNTAYDILHKTNKELIDINNCFQEYDSFSVQEYVEEKYDESKIKLHRILKSLPEIYKTTIYLFYFEEMSIKEIAVLTNASESNVKKRLQRARQQIFIKFKN